LNAIGVLVAAIVLAASILAGCGGSGDSTDASRPELVVFGAASLGPAFEKYGDDFDGADVRFSFAGSDDLAAQIRQGVTPDVYAAANTSLPEELHKDGLLDRPTTFASNKLVIGVPEGSEIKDVADLEQPGVKIAIGDEEVPVGIYTREVLKALGPGAEQAILANVASSEPDVAGIVGKLTQGAVDAGFVYVTDVNATNGQLKAIELPAEVEPQVTYEAGVVKGAKHPTEGQDYVDGLTNGACADALKKAGFGPAP